MAEIIVDIKPRGMASAYVEAPFDKGKEALAKEGYRIISLQENARLRMQEGSKEEVSKYGNWTREGVIYVPKKGASLTKNSPIMANVKQATDCHRNGEEFYLTDEQVEQSLADSVKLTREVIPTNRFGENEITAYVFGEDAEKYGEFLKEAEINEMPVFWLADVQDKAFVRQMWLCGLGDGGSGLVGVDGNLNFRGRVRGVQDSAEGTTKNFEVYTIQDIQNALKTKNLTGIEKILIEGLKQ